MKGKFINIFCFLAFVLCLFISILTDSVGLIGGGRILRTNNPSVFWSLIAFYILGILITLFNLKRLSNKKNEKSDDI
jgi:amino acid transporter